MLPRPSAIGVPFATVGAFATLALAQGGGGGPPLAHLAAAYAGAPPPPTQHLPLLMHWDQYAPPSVTRPFVVPKDWLKPPPPLKPWTPYEVPESLFEWSDLQEPSSPRKLLDSNQEVTSTHRKLKATENNDAEEPTSAISPDGQSWDRWPVAPFVVRRTIFVGDGGKFFDDSDDRDELYRKKARQVNLYGSNNRLALSKVILHGSKDKLSGVEFVYGSDKDTILHGTIQTAKKELVLKGNEDVIGGSFGICRVNGDSRVCGAKFDTNQGNSVSLGDLGGQRHNNPFTVPAGYSLVGMFGREETQLDAAAIIAVNRREFDAAVASVSAVGTALQGNQNWNTSPLLPYVAKSVPIGYSGNGKAFSGLSTFESDIRDVKILKIELHGLGEIHGIIVYYADNTLGRYGTTTRYFVSLGLAESEYITEVTFANCQPKTRRTLKPNKRVCYAKFTTNFGNIISSGFPRKESKTFAIPPGFELKGFEGRQGKGLDEIRLVISSMSSEAPPPV